MSESIEGLRHDEATRGNILTDEHQAMLPNETQHPVRVACARRSRHLDPQLVWRGKDKQALLYLVVPAPPLYISGVPQ
jgi:adenine-specific DNA-methyltransferase